MVSRGLNIIFFIILLYSGCSHGPLQSPGPGGFFYRAAGHGDVGAFHRADLSREQLEAPNQHGVTLLMVAARNGQVETTSYLILQGVDPNVSDVDDDRALNYALPSKNKIVEKILIAGGADASLGDRFGVVPILYWAHVGDWDMVLEALNDPGSLENLSYIEGHLRREALLARQHQVLRILREYDAAKRLSPQEEN